MSRGERGCFSKGTGIRWLVLGAICVGLASCGTVKPQKTSGKRSKEYFAESEYGVKASPRVAYGKNIPKGGGRYIVGKPYVVRGKRYVPKEDFGYDKVGVASWYGSAFHGRLTANGEVYDLQGLTAAHPTFPLPSYARVTNVENGASIIVRVNDRGPYHSNRLIDLSGKTAEMLDLKHSGTGKVRVQYVGKARMDGHDMPFLMASYRPKGSRGPQIAPEGQIATGVMVASAEPLRKQVQTLDAQASAIGYGGNTPSASYQDAAQPFAAMPSAAPAPMAAPAEMASFPALPDVGPFPYERPMYTLGTMSAASAYIEVPANADGPFDAVLKFKGELTPESILASYHRNNS
ncbi:septal ring lytic transglycosylase RlpA family protein [Gellertiella hungarica]|uniref:Endolytic peptidoglycan transglycosylase RlpA n=1 Tax=Gellertiella hungarica TaxID=1572859 RepID=A0A7W6J4Q6_9HYPH|nr:septal ring lytic transglycosylase RlpA family protein [Gellertiella hungarica]MBB4064766.1 rare lipoprotein A [Gellertiella hungarica]